jgi:plasmid stabilization system protein ParE
VSLPVLFRPEASTELTEAWDWYEARRAGLGGEFVTCVEAAVAGAARTPEVNPRVHGEVRRALVRRFPYGVFYLVEGQALLVLAVAHARRKPGYWLARR